MKHDNNNSMALWIILIILIFISVDIIGEMKTIISIVLGIIIYVRNELANMNE